MKINFDKQTIFGVTLLELMAVVAILATVAVVAIPTYENYLDKSRISSALPTLAAMSEAARLQYQEDHALNILTFANTTFNNNVVTSLDMPPVVNGLYIPPGGQATVNESSYVVCIYIRDLRFSGYTEPTAGNAGTRARLCQKTTAGDTIFTNICGAFDGSATDIPSEFLPETCNCANVSTGAC